MHSSKKLTLATLTPQQVHEDQVSLQKEYELYGTKKKNPKMQKVGMTKTNQRKKESDNSVIECGKARKSNMFARVKDVRKALHSNQILLILFCKRRCSLINLLPPCIVLSLTFCRSITTCFPMTSLTVCHL